MPLSLSATRPPATVPPSASVAEVAHLMKERNVGAVVVVDGKRPVGILTDRDIVLRVLESGRHPGQTHANEVMSSPLVTCTDDASPNDAFARMRERRIHRIPVVSPSGELVSMIRWDDLAQQPRSLS